MSRVDEVVAAARVVLERDGTGGLTMQAVADELQIKAPSLYKHIPGKRAIEVALVALALSEMGQGLHAAVRAVGADGDRTGGPGAVSALLGAYRRHALAHPDMYRLATAGPLPRDELPEGLEAWAGEPFYLVTRDPHRAQALWSFAHGMVVLELDDRYPPGSDLDITWAEGADAFSALTSPAGGPRA